MKAVQKRTSIILFLLLLSLGPRSFGGMDPEQQYNARWAVVVGINYESVPDDSELSKLKFAEDDAKGFHELLLKNYGFDAKNAKLLLGADATRAAIEKELDEIYKQAEEEDCVIFYFSGHGVERQVKQGKPTRGQLLAADVQFHEGSPSASEVMEMQSLVKNLDELCRARHKLLILDCCYSGIVFSNLGRRAGEFDAYRVDESVYRSPGFQAMSASREGQKAGDGKVGHSPFTDALLKALNGIPRKKTKGDGFAPFTTTELFRGMRVYLDQNLGDGQTPLCSWLDNGQGEFHFFPDGEFPDLDKPDSEKRKVMLAMVPGSFGLWWFEETPWFMPGLRYEIVASNEVQRSVLDMISPLRLEQAANDVCLKLKAMEDTPEDIKARIGHLEKLLNAKGKEWDNVVKDVMLDLKERVTADAEGKRNAVDPLDLHYLAVLQHGMRQDLDEAKKNYDEALALYEKKAEHSPELRPLMALCLADRAGYSTGVERNYEQACDFYAKARRVYADFTPPPFQIYVLCREAEALSKLGRRGMARQRLKEARDAAIEVDPQENYPLTASLYSAAGWLKMDWCEFPQAMEDFESSTRILAKSLEKDDSDHDAAIRCMYNDHGIALAQRYLGNSSAAEEMCRVLLKDKIFTRVRMMNDGVGRESNYRQIKARLTDRWINTLERCGDCSLFGNPQDVAQAADDYRRAVRATRYLPPEKALAAKRKMRLKWALALALKSKIQDLDLADEQRNEIDKIENEMPESSRQLVPSLKIIKEITRLIVAHCNSLACAGQDCKDVENFKEDLDKFRGELDELAEKNFLDSSLSRDDIESAMFALKVILEEFPDPSQDVANKGKGRVERRKDIELLLEFCRLGRRGGVQGLHFVRPYYDCAVAGLIKLEPKDTKQLIEVSWEAMMGKPHFKVKSDQATLVLYCMADQAPVQTNNGLGEAMGYFFLDVPRGTSAIYEIPPGVDFNSIVDASNRESIVEGGLDLPADLRKELFAATGEIRVGWRDLVRQLGTNDAHRQMQAGLDDPHGQTVTMMVAKEYFPFAVPEIVHISDEPLPIDPLAKKNVAPSAPALTSTKTPGATEVSVPQ